MRYSVASIFTHAFVPKQEIRNLEKVKAELTYTPSYGDNVQPVAVYRERDDWFGFPLYYPIKAKKIVD